jgi:hypothetical protein
MSCVKHDQNYLQLKVKVKVSRYMPRRYRGEVKVQPGLEGVGSQRHAPAALPPRKQTRYPFYSRHCLLLLKHFDMMLSAHHNGFEPGSCDADISLLENILGKIAVMSSEWELLLFFREMSAYFFH